MFVPHETRSSWRTIDWSVEVTLDYPEGNVKLDSFQSWVVNNEMVLEGKDGSRFPSSSYLLEESSPRHAVFTYHFNDKEKMKRGLARLEARLPDAGPGREGPHLVLLQGRAAAVRVLRVPTLRVRQVTAVRRFSPLASPPSFP